MHLKFLRIFPYSVIISKTVAVMNYLMHYGYGNVIFPEIRFKKPT